MLRPACWLLLAVLPWALAGCGPSPPPYLQGYVEGEYVYVASPQAGALKKLHVYRGTHVEAEAPLFSLDEEPQREMRDEAERRLAAAQSNLEDARKGKRPSELSSLEAQLSQFQATLLLAEKELKRQEHLSKTAGATTQQELDRTRATHDLSRQKVMQLEADLKTARLGAREDQIAAAEAEVRARQANLAHATWELQQKSQSAGQAGFVFDTLYREGEWVAAGKPVVVLLPPENIKVRAFIPQGEVGKIQLGDAVRVRVDGQPQTFVGKVSYISPKAEYTPPVIYSRESRSKLVFMIEAVFEPEAAKQLHPGEPVEVTWGDGP